MRVVYIPTLVPDYAVPIQEGRELPRTLHLPRSAAPGCLRAGASRIPLRSCVRASLQNSSLIALAGKAFTTVLAGFAFTKTSLPKINLLPAFVAGFLRVLIVTKPGTTNLPFFFASAVAMLARVLRAWPMTFLFTSQLSAMAAMRALLVMTVPFIMGAISVAEAAQAGAWSEPRRNGLSQIA